MPGVKGRSGRLPNEITHIKELLKKEPHKVLEVMDALYHRALVTIECPNCKHPIPSAGDTQAAIYYCNRILGMPTTKAEIEAKVQTLVLNADDLERLETEYAKRFDIHRASEQKFLEEGQTYDSANTPGIESSQIGIGQPDKSESTPRNSDNPLT